MRNVAEQPAAKRYINVLDYIDGQQKRYRSKEPFFLVQRIARLTFEEFRSTAVRAN
jgi:hypothetical protein